MPVIDQRYDPAYPIAQLIEHPDNARRGDEAAIDASMAAHGFYGAVLVQASTRRIIAGNHRTRVARRRGDTTVPVLLVDVDDDRARRILLADNRTNDRASYDRDELARLLGELAGTDDVFAGTGWDNDDLGALLRSLERDDAGARPTLADRWGAPPFSVLDARAGYWRERKRRWLHWGLRSSDGRADALVAGGGFQNAAKWGRSIGKVLRPGPEPAEWTGGTSIFDPVLAELMVRWFCPPGGRVADPFAGGTVRGAVASALGHPYVGYDLAAAQVAANVEQGRQLELDPFPDWRVGDARHARWDGSFDMLLTCPPYWDLERYGDDPADLCNAADESAFVTGLAACLVPAVDALAANSFVVVVMGFVRNGDRLVDLPGHTAALLADLRLVVYNDFVLATSPSTAAFRADRAFRTTRKPVPVHQRVVVAVKGDPRAAADRCGPVDATDDALVAAWTDDDDVEEVGDP